MEYARCLAEATPLLLDQNWLEFEMKEKQKPLAFRFVGRYY